MPKKTHGLARGLDSLLPEVDMMTSGGGQEIAIGDIDPNPDQPRRAFSEESIAQLAQSIREQGLLQPILVVPMNGGRYRIVAGERRWRAARMAGLERVPCIIREMDVPTQMEIALVENLQREDLNPIEAAQGIQTLMRQCGYTQEAVAARLCKSRPAVANLLRLLTLPEDIITMVRQGTLSAGHARVLAGLESDEMKMTLARQTITNEWSVRQLENAVALMRKSTPTLPKTPQKVHSLPAELTELETFCRETFGVRATITGNQKKGKITLQYYSAEELEQIEQRLDVLHKLKRKYGASVEDVLAFLEQARSQLDEIEFASDKIERLRAQLAKQDEEVQQAGLALREARKQAAVELEQRIQTELSQLDMPKVQFQCQFEEQKPQETGLDLVRFLMSANVGEALRPMAKVASGGELARLRFAEIVLERPNLLFLDEPTNHLDIYTRENLTEALMAYTGTLLLVTHDRHLMNSLACPILYLEDGKAVLYPSYDALMGRAAPVQTAQKAAEPVKTGYGKEQRRRRAELRAKIKACEDEMEACGAREVELDNEINSPEVYNDPDLLRQKSDELSDLRFHQEELFAAWEAAMEEQEAYEQTQQPEE